MDQLKNERSSVGDLCTYNSAVDIPQYCVIFPKHVQRILMPSGHVWLLSSGLLPTVCKHPSISTLPYSPLRMHCATAVGAH